MSIPRRAYIQMMVPAELAIREAIHKVEAIGADVVLTEAVNLLTKAQDKVSDYVDREVPHGE